MDNSTLLHFLGEIDGPIVKPIEFASAYPTPIELRPEITYTVTAKLELTDKVDKATLKATNFVLKTKTRNIVGFLLLEPTTATPFYQIRFSVRPTTAEVGEAQLVSIADGVKDVDGADILTSAIASLPIKTGQSEYIDHTGRGVEGDSIATQPWGLEDDVPVWTITFSNGFTIRYCLDPVRAGATGTTPAYPFEFKASGGFSVVSAQWEGLDATGLLVSGTDGSIGLSPSGAGWLENHIFSLYKPEVTRYFITLVTNIGDVLLASINVN